MNKPFGLRPAAKDYLWGGNRLNEEFHKNIDSNPLAETWECSTHPDGLSIVRNGAFSGQTLAQVLQKHPEFLGTRSEIAGDLPIMIKLIDAKEDLSVQVHPDDAYAFSHEDGQRGKTEMWYVLDATPAAKLVYGLSQATDPSTLRKALENGKVNRYLQKVPIQKDDVFFIEAGTIHAIGKGALIAEIQENSNLTYRLYDYDRVDKDGTKRPLHIDKALDVANLKRMKEPRQPMRVLNYRPGMASELLCRCKYFEVFRMLVHTDRNQEVSFRADELSYRVLLCVDGSGTYSYSEGEAENVTNVIRKGDCIFIPADSVDIQLHGKMQILDVRG